MEITSDERLYAVKVLNASTLAKVPLSLLQKGHSLEQRDIHYLNRASEVVNRAYQHSHEVLFPRSMEKYSAENEVCFRMVSEALRISGLEAMSAVLLLQEKISCRKDLRYLIQFFDRLSNLPAGFS